MHDPAKSPPSSGAPVKQGWSFAKNGFPRLPVLVGVIGLGAIVTTGTLVKRQADARTNDAITAVRAEVVSRRAELERYEGRIKNLRWHAEKIRQASEMVTPDARKGWVRERARLFEQLLARIDRSAAEAEFARTLAEIEQKCRAGDGAAARALLPQLPRIRFPEPAEFRQAQEESYLRPLAEFSRQNPGYYQAFHELEPEAAMADLAALRTELADSELLEITPQLMLRFELLSAVAPADDPLVADWNAIANASDFFENPDAATLALWRAAQKAIRSEDWQTAVARMQSIAKTTVRTRQPYRAAYGRALLKQSPDQTTAAYPFLEEAAKVGDSAAREWVAQEDCAQGRFADAIRWLESAVVDGESGAVPKLLELYARPDVAVDLGREAMMLNRIMTTPDAPPLTALLLARLYENGGGVPTSAAKAFALYRAAAEKNVVAAWSDLARCYANGIGTTADPLQACEWACRAYGAGERVESAGLLLELMRRQPDYVATAVQEMFEHEQVAAPAGFLDIRLQESNVAKLKVAVAQHLDKKGRFARAAQLYAQSGVRDAAVAHRHAELTMVRACETCAGVGKVKTSTPCPTCGGKGTVLCHVCDGRGYRFMPGAPPCTTCGGSGTIVQNGRALSCSTCAGTGKGKGSVTKQPCSACAQGREICRDCTGGRITSMKECPDCRGTGARALADQ